MKNSRPRIKYSQTPHSVARRIETIPNKTAAALLSLINRKTVGFGQGFVDLSYSQITGELRVHERTLSRAAKKLEEWGDIVRERVAHRIYRWKIVLCRDEIIEDPTKTYVTRATSEIENEDGQLALCKSKKNAHQDSGGRSNCAHLTNDNVTAECHGNVKNDEGVLTDLSGPCGSICQDHADRSVRTKAEPVEQEDRCDIKSEELVFEQEKEPLKNSYKETLIKKQQQEPRTKPELAAGNTDDEPLHKFCLRTLKSYGVRQRVARQLCREYEHDLIKSVLDSVPQLSGVKNVAGYLVAAIKDGGYETTTSSPQGKKNGHQGSGDRSNYAHLTDHNVTAQRHRNVKAGDAPISYRSVEETREEVERLEAERREREARYCSEKQTLAQKFRGLSDDVKAALKKLAAECLEKMVPSTGRREEMLRDVTFQRIANRQVLEQFFSAVERGLDEKLALNRLVVVGGQSNGVV